ncbi:cystathionine beta-lyase [Aliarcobacter cryaerophilus ATCC 43158]|uniref:cysteine-S-conjugate beta-lyase n=1 Tax=Aliarcobacter cryaerophilus ATCC 43158 TaxID=1032070 RepID=A0AAD0TXK1_9BACT|nr:MalY/PatB family protein [Aliarcobacter cryaerophilus]AYJ80383.1 putative C-S lyase [Aliarcobacter cryaerophilus ATCC 43158]PRM98794.1 cystathionine beta-lyase [Aliarcobacter cryaerophilus]QCZ24595.1 cystathionine beta-lyase [Aliarcobacter cryaerophilus ATCC 43158]
MKYNFDKVINRKNTNCYKWDTTKDGVIPMWVADMDFEVAQPILNSIIKRTNHGVFGYTVVDDGYFDAEINWWKKRFNCEIKKEWIEPTTGVIPSLASIIQTFCQKNDKVLIQTPVYHYFAISIKNSGCEVLENELIYENDKYSVDLKDFEIKIKTHNPKLFILCNPHNQVGKVFSKDELKAMGEICQKYNVLVVSDEIHRDLVYKGFFHTPYISLGEDFLQNSITCTSATKTFNLAGLKASNIVVANKDLRVKLDKTLNKNEIKSLNVFGIEATKTAYQECEDWLDELLVYLEKNRDFVDNFLKENLPNLKLIEAEATYLLWIDISSLKIKSKDFTKKLEDFGNVRVISGITFGKNGDNFIRVNIACRKDILKEALLCIKKTIENF